MNDLGTGSASRARRPPRVGIARRGPRASRARGCYTTGTLIEWSRIGVLCAVALSLTAAEARARDAGADDASAEAPQASNIVDFTDDEGIAGGEELTAAPPEPLEHESLLPDRFRGPGEPAPASAPPVSRGKRGCGGCRVDTGDSAGAWLWLGGVGLALAVRRRRGARR